MRNAAKYRVHRTIAIIVVPLILISTATGFLRANQKWYWEEGYKKKKQPADFSITRELKPFHIISQTLDSISQKKNQYQEVNLQAEGTNLYYRITTTSKEKYLAEAYTGEIVSPLSKELASEFASLYVKEKAKVKSCELLKDYTPRKGKQVKAAYKIEFDNKVHSQVFLDYQTGEIVEDIDDNRQFGLWIVKLHDYDFFNSKRRITSIVGVSILLLSLSGLWIYKIRIKRKKRNNRIIQKKN